MNGYRRAVIAGPKPRVYSPPPLLPGDVMRVALRRTDGREARYVGYARQTVTRGGDDWALIDGRAKLMRELWFPMCTGPMFEGEAISGITLLSHDDSLIAHGALTPSFYVCNGVIPGIVAGGLTIWSG
jgi:hypothetical protein